MFLEFLFYNSLWVSLPFCWSADWLVGLTKIITQLLALYNDSNILQTIVGIKNCLNKFLTCHSLSLLLTTRQAKRQTDEQNGRMDHSQQSLTIIISFHCFSFYFSYFFVCIFCCLSFFVIFLCVFHFIVPLSAAASSSSS